MMRRFRAESGVAMVTVLLVGATLTGVSSAAALLAISDFRGVGDDRRSAEVLAIADAGIDRFLIEVRAGDYNWKNLSEAGCLKTPPRFSGQIGNGSFDAQFTIYDATKAAEYRTPKSPWTAANDTDTSYPNPCVGRSNNVRSNPPLQFAITSTGTVTGASGAVAAKRVVRQIVTVGAAGLPVGVYADKISGGGTPNASNISLLTPGDLTGRDKIDFAGNDAYYLKSDFYSGQPSVPVPAAAHATGTVFVKNSAENPPSPNCTSSGEYAWDGSKDGTSAGTACAGGNAPTSLFNTSNLNQVVKQPMPSAQELATLKATAQSKGFYCGPSTSTCTKDGAPYTLTGNIKTTDMAGLPSDDPTNDGDFVAYFDFPPGNPSANTVNWDAAIKTDPVSCLPVPFRAVTLIVRNANLRLTSGASVTGLIVLPEGKVDLGGTYSVHGTILAKEVSMQGTGSVQLSQCWLDHMPGAELQATRIRWGELDR